MEADTNKALIKLEKLKTESTEIITSLYLVSILILGSVMR
jgi:hypothetical protein